MKRILFAMARGARIQRLYYLQTASDVADPKWEDTLEISTNIGSDYDYRIHPEDEHLQYGFISHAMRERVIWLDGAWDSGYAEAMAYVCTRWPEWVASASYTAPEAESTLLFIAEFLADEGL